MANESNGKEVLNIPFGEIIREVALGIAEAQFELDKSSMNVAELMSGQRVLRAAETGEPILDANKAPQILDSRVFFGHEVAAGGSGAEITATKGRLGQIASITIDDGAAGSGYTVEDTAIRITGGAQKTEGTPASAKVIGVDKAGAITEIEITDPGSGYTRRPNITFVDTRDPAEGKEATATAALDDLDKVISFDVENGGTGYVVTPKIRLVGGTDGEGIDAKAIATIEDGQIIKVEVEGDQHGSGYSSAPTVEVISEASLQPLKMSMIELGFTPNFYQFVDTVIDMRLALRVNKSERGSYKITASTVDANYASSYNFALNMATTVKTKIVPIPPPLILEERIRQMIDSGQQFKDIEET